MKLPFTVERRDRPEAAEPKYKWLLPLMVTIAIVVLVVIVIYSSATGVFIG